MNIFFVGYVTRYSAPLLNCSFWKTNTDSWHENHIRLFYAIRRTWRVESVNNVWQECILCRTRLLQSKWSKNLAIFFDKKIKQNDNKTLRLQPNCGNLIIALSFWSMRYTGCFLLPAWSEYFHELSLTRRHSVLTEHLGHQNIMLIQRTLAELTVLCKQQLESYTSRLQHDCAW